MEFGIELLNAIVDRQQQREAEFVEQLRQAIAASGVPLPEDLAAAVVNQFITQMRDTMRWHPGYKLAERRDSYRISLSILQNCISDLQMAIDRFEAFALSNEWLAPNHRDRAVGFERIIQKELFATANAAVSLVEHARRVTDLHVLPDYNRKRQEIFGSDGLHEFVVGLRVFLHHLHTVNAGWTISGGFGKEQSATFMLDVGELQRLIEEHRRKLGAKYESMKAYVGSQKRKLDLRKTFIEYQVRVVEFHDWMVAELESNALVALRDHDALYRRKKLCDARLNYRALLGNWLNWRIPPDPHGHLARYLTPEQIADVNLLPRNSKEQVDRIIAYADREGAVDDDIRKQLYELFRRAP